MQTTFLLDKQFTPDLGYPLGKIGVRVVVFPKRKDKASSVDSDVPLDLQAEEDFSTSDSEVNGYLEFPKRGKMCCVFLINGQRHHGLDNTFIVNDLKMKYLRKRMIIAVDLDALSQDSKLELARSWHTGVANCAVFDEIKLKLVTTLRADTELNELADELQRELARLEPASAEVQKMFGRLVAGHYRRECRIKPNARTPAPRSRYS